MKFYFKRIVLIVFTCFTATLMSAKTNSTGSDAHFWSPIIDAIIEVESGGDAKAKSGNYCGAMQISPILVKECNNILKERNSKKRYTLQDRFSVEKSKEMFLLIQSHHNPEKDVEQAIRAWNGGNNYTVKSTQKYYNKVLAAMK